MSGTNVTKALQGQAWHGGSNTSTPVSTPVEPLPTDAVDHLPERARTKA